MAKRGNIVNIRRGNNFNIGMAIFLIIIIYVAFNVFYYLTSKNIAIYEVTQGTIATNNVYKGLIIRDEKVSKSAYDGYINYYQKAASRVASTDVVYSIDTKGNISDEINTANLDGTKLSKESLAEISDDLDEYMNTFDLNNFSGCYNFKDELNSKVAQILSQEALSSLDNKVSNAVANNTFYKVNAADTGIIEYYTDGFENVSPSDVTYSMLDSSSYKKTTLTSNTSVKKGDAVYKLIKSEDWDVIMSIPKDVAESIKDEQYIKVKFCEDDYTCYGKVTLSTSGDATLLDLSFTNAMIRYISDRYTEVELVINDESGLKIPKSSIVSKEFYTVPVKYFTKGGNSDDPTLFIKKQDQSDGDYSKTVTPQIYYKTDDFYYIDSESVTAGDTVIMMNSSETYTIGKDTDSILGVYNVNKGYAVFKQIEIIYENDEYAIVNPKTDYGVALYDHIALDGSKVSENELTTKSAK